jgi:outer membrane protein assembly factor BamA
MYRAMGIQDKADELDRLCKDLTKRFTEGGLTAREIRRVPSPQVKRVTTSTSDRRATQKCVLLVGFSQLDFGTVINCISFAALSDEDVLNKDIQCVRDYADQGGFRQFRILSVTRGNFAEDCPSSVRIVAEEGKKHYLGSVSFSGASIPKPVLDSFLLKPGDPYCKKRIETVIEQIKQYFLSEGFALVNATVIEAVNPNGVVAVRFTIVPGVQITVHRLVIEGNRALDATALEQFKQKLPFKEGERLCKVPSDADLKDITLFHFENGIALEGLDWQYRDTPVRSEKDVIVTIKQRLASEWRH